MNCLDEKMINILSDLIKHHCISGLKAEFETEGASYQDAILLRNITKENNLKFTIKIGGCGAIKDLYDAKKIQADEIVAPMIETPYAAEKFIKSINNVFKDEEIKTLKTFINIETKTGFQFLDEILKLNSADKISGIIAGRGDMAGSLGKTCQMVNSNEIFNMVNSISKKCKKYDKEFIIGGGISLASIPFLKKIEDFEKFETRKIIFNKEALKGDIEKGIIKAIEFEILWLKNKKEIFECDIKRLDILEKRLSKQNTPYIGF